MILRSSERFVVSQPGIETRHCFSAGGHYDAARLGVGALVGIDEHRIAPGAGFPEHGHRGVDIVSWVADGVLRHDADLLVGPGDVLVQSTASGVRHVETNGSHEPLRLIQMTLLSAAETPDTRLGRVPLVVAGGRFDVHTAGSREVVAPAYVFVVRGAFSVNVGRYAESLAAGDSCSLDADRTLTGEGELLVWELSRHPS